MTKQRKMYQVREWVGSEYSRQLGQKLRERSDAARIVKALKKEGRAVFSSSIMIQA